MLILYTTEDGESRIQLRAGDETVWLSQREMAELFDVSQDNVGLHLKNIYTEAELDREGSRQVRCPLTLYNLDAIRKMTKKHNRYLKKLGLPTLPDSETRHST